MNLLPLCTAIVCPTNSGLIVEDRAQLLMTRFSPDLFIRWIFFSRLSWTKGPFLTLLGILDAPYFVLLPRRRPRTI